MNSTLSADRRSASTHPQDEGIAMVVAISLMGLVAIIVLALVSVALYEARATGRDRQRSGAVMVAEGRVDTLMAAIQSATTTTLPCGTLTTGDTSVMSDAHDVTAEVSYFDATGAPVDCAAVHAGTPVTQAAISASSQSDAIAGTSAARRTVETLLELSPVFGSDLDKAIFGDGGVQVANKADIYGTDGEPNADIYTNGNMSCDNNQHYHGSIFAQGTVSMSNACVVDVDVQAKNGFSSSNPQVSVGGKVLVSNGNISLDKAHVGIEARAGGTVTGKVCDDTPEKCIEYDGTVPAPPVQAFPEYLWADAQADWAALGYTNVETFPRTGFPCGNYNGPPLEGRNLKGKVDGVGAWLVTYADALPADTIILANCPGVPILSQGNFPIDLSANLAIISKGGVTFANQTTISSTGGDRFLYLVQPYDAVPHPCTVDGIALDNQVTVEPEVDVMLYSPCNIRKANNTTHYGQIYSGGIAKIDNALTMYFNPLPMPISSNASTTVESYDVTVVYKRESI